MEWFLTLNPIYQAGLAGLFTWACTALGAASVFFVKEVNQRFLAIMQGFAGGRHGGCFLLVFIRTGLKPS